MMGDMMAEYGGRLLLAIAGVGLGFLALVSVLKFWRQRNGTLPFTLTGKPRAQRLQVLDATAIDTRRRLVLIRRDDVEHLILIGGPADVVIESDIGANKQAAEPYRPRLEQAYEAFRPMDATPPRSTSIPEPAAASYSAPFTPEERPAPPRPVTRRLPESQEIPQPVTPQAAYFEASDDFDDDYEDVRLPVAPPAPPVLDKDALALKEAEEHLEAMKRRMQGRDPVKTRGTAERSASGSGFGRVLDEEMKTPLRSTERPVPPAIQQMSRRPATQQAPEKESDIQDEIARIFGEKR